MSNVLWTPGYAGPLEELVARIERRVEEFARGLGIDAAEVEVELLDGEVHVLESISAEPGYGFVTLVPHTADGDLSQMIVPIGVIRRLTIRPPEPQRSFGFTLPSA